MLHINGKPFLNLGKFIDYTPSGADTLDKLIQETTEYKPLHPYNVNYKLLCDHIYNNEYQDSFTVKNILEVDLKYSTELVLKAIITDLVKLGKYKKYGNIWKWVPPLQERFLNTDWDKKIKKRPARKVKPVQFIPSVRSRFREGSISGGGSIAEVTTDVTGVSGWNFTITTEDEIQRHRAQIDRLQEEMLNRFINTMPPPSEAQPDNDIEDTGNHDPWLE